MLVENKAISVPQIGYGWDWLAKHGTRAGIELSTGADEGGPVMLVSVFAVWGPPRR